MKTAAKEIAMKIYFTILVGMGICFFASLVVAATDLPSYEIHMRNGLKDIEDGRLYPAKKEFEFITAHPQWEPAHRAIAYLNLGVISVLEGNLDSAIKNYQAAIQLNPD